MFVVHQNQSGIHHLLGALDCPGGTETPHKGSDLQICWSVDSAVQRAVSSVTSKSAFWLNHPFAVRAASDADYVKAILQLNGIQPYVPSNKRQMTVKKTFHVAVCNLRVLALFNGRTRVSTAVYSKVGNLAVKATQALQLDFAFVSVKMTTSNTLLVASVNPLPPLSKSLAAIFAVGIRRFAEQWRSKSDAQQRIVIGADVEFVLLTPNGKVSPASLYVPRHGIVGHDALRMNHRRRLYPLVELRPRPAKRPEQLMLHLLRAMHLAARTIKRPSLRWVAGAMPLRRFAIGGHLHISRFWLSSVFLRVLDRYLALPLMMCESGASVKRRLKYGRLSDYRRQFHGGFEYRSLPSWIVEPNLAQAVISLFYVLALTFKQLPQEATVRFADTHFQRAFYTGDKHALLDLVRQGWQQLDALEPFRQYREQIAPLRRQSLEMQTWDEQQDVRPAWRVPPFHRQT